MYILRTCNLLFIIGSSGIEMNTINTLQLGTAIQRYIVIGTCIILCTYVLMHMCIIL